MIWKRAVVVLCAIVLSAPAYSADFDSLLRQARQLDRDGSIQQAVSLCNAIIKLRPGATFEPRVRFFLGNLLIKSHASTESISAQFSEIANAFPNSPEAPGALLRIGYLRDAVNATPTEWQQLVDKYPQSKEAARALYRLGFIALKQRDPELALERFESVAKIANADSNLIDDSRVQAGYAHISRYWKSKDKSVLKDGADVFQALSASTKAGLPSVRAHLGLGEIYLIQGNGEAAATQYQAAIAAKPANAYLQGIAQFGLGCALYTKHDNSGAEAALGQFLANIKGASLAEKDRAWKLARPGYANYAESDPARAAGLSGLDLVTTADYWRAASLVELKRYADAMSIITELQPMAGRRFASRVENLRKICAHELREDR